MPVWDRNEELHRVLLKLRILLNDIKWYGDNSARLDEYEWKRQLCNSINIIIEIIQRLY